MSIFGSREEDPLLQNDPLAPPSDDSSDSSSAHPEGLRSDSDSPLSNALTEAESPGPGAPFAFPEEGPTRTLRRSVEAAREGHLSILNAAFDQGWRLTRIEYQEQTADLLLVLRREASETDRTDRIV